MEKVFVFRIGGIDRIKVYIGVHVIGVGYVCFEGICVEVVFWCVGFGLKGYDVFVGYVQFGYRGFGCLVGYIVVGVELICFFDGVMKFFGVFVLVHFVEE